MATLVTRASRRATCSNSDCNARSARSSNWAAAAAESMPVLGSTRPRCLTRSARAQCFSPAGPARPLFCATRVASRELSPGPERSGSCGRAGQPARARPGHLPAAAGRPGPASPSRPKMEPCGSPCLTTALATTHATPRSDRVSGTWPTGSPRSAVGSRSPPPPAAAPPSPGTSPPYRQRRCSSHSMKHPAHYSAHDGWPGSSPTGEHGLSTLCSGAP
jgi:hypothetical protein